MALTDLVRKVGTAAEASATLSGVVTTGSQVFGGVKTFSDGIKLPTAGGTAVILDFYATSVVNGHWVPNGTGVTNSSDHDIRFSRIGDIVTITSPRMNDAHPGTSSSYVLFSGTIPTWAWPAGTRGGTCFMFNNGAIITGELGQVTISSSGSLIANKNAAGAAFTDGAGHVGTEYFTLTYSVLAAV